VRVRATDTMTGIPVWQCFRQESISSVDAIKIAVFLAQVEYNGKFCNSVGIPGL